MSERYVKLFSLPADLYAEGSPVVISAGNLLKDNETGRVLVQLKIKNASPKTVKGATVIVHALDTAGLPLDGDAEKEYLDFSAAPGTEFGQKAAIPLPRDTTRGFTAAVSKAVFADNSVWTGADAPWEPLPPAAKINDPELSKQLQLTFGGSCTVFPQAHKDLWRCACGAWNKGETCYACGKKQAALFPLDLSALNAAKDARLAQEKAEREAREAAEKAAREAAAIKQRKILEILVPALTLCAVIIFAITRVVVPMIRYSKAAALYEAGQYEEAIAAFEALDGFKDSEAQIDSAKTAIAEQARLKAEQERLAAEAKAEQDRLEQEAKAEQERLAQEARIEAEKAAAYEQAEALQKAGSYEDAIRAFQELGNYKDSAERCTEARYEQAAMFLTSGEYERALQAFLDLGQYKDSETQTLETRYQWAKSLASFGSQVDYANVERAREMFEQLGDYKDAEAQVLLFQKRLLKSQYTPRDKSQKVTETTYLYDEYGRDISNGEVYDEKGQVIQDKTYTYSYDEDGRLKEKAEIYDSRNRDTAYAYTIRNGRITEERYVREYYWSYKQSIDKTTIVNSYTYDAAGRLIRKEHKVNGTVQSYIVFKYNGEGLLAEEEEKSYLAYTKQYYTSTLYKYVYDGDVLVEKKNVAGTFSDGSFTYDYGYIYAPKAQASEG